jgi:DDE family transposase
MVGRPVLWPLVWKIHALQVHREPAPQDPEGARYRVTNWPEYDDALMRRGSLTVWFTGKAVSAWHAPATGERGGQPVYSALAIGTGLALRLVFQQPFIAAPDHTTLSPPWQAHHHAMSRPDCQSCDERYHAKGWRSHRIGMLFGEVMVKLPRLACAGCGCGETGVPSTSPQRATYPTGRIDLFMIPQSMDGLASHSLPRAEGAGRSPQQHLGAVEVAELRHRYAAHRRRRRIVAQGDVAQLTTGVAQCERAGRRYNQGVHSKSRHICHSHLSMPRHKYFS